ncbi:MAG: LacI family DNA-binding transcriptional regulator [Kiritimatiellae bacterium]|nr:LacI family DNA-binding transcriptional regulator [Kiritimatiellia bacterium]
MPKNKITLADVAKRAGVSKTAVSFVLNGRDKGLSDTTKKRVLDAAARLGYLKRASVVTRRDWIRVADLVSPQGPVMMTTFFAGVRQHLQQKAHLHRLQVFSMLFDPAARPGARNGLSLPELTGAGADVFVTHNAEWATLLERNGLPVILFQGGPVPNVLCLHCDDLDAGRQAALHALEMGHRSAGTICPPWTGRSVEGRVGGFVATFTRRGGKCPARYRWTIETDHDAIVRDIATRARNRKLPTLFYCYADNFMLAAMRGFQRAGLAVPRDVSLIGTDDLYWGRYLTPALTTVHLCEELFAEKLVDAIRHVVNGGQPYRLAVPVKLAKRETVRRLPM